MTASLLVGLLLLGQTPASKSKTVPPAKSATAKKADLSTSEAAARKAEFQANVRKGIDKRRAVAKGKASARMRAEETAEFQSRMEQQRAMLMMPIISAQQYLDSQASLEKMRAIAQAEASQANAQAYTEMIRLQQLRLAVWQEMSPAERTRVEQAEQLRAENERKALLDMVRTATGQGPPTGGVVPGHTPPHTPEHQKPEHEKPEHHKPEHSKEKK